MNKLVIKHHKMKLIAILVCLGFVSFVVKEQVFKDADISSDNNFFVNFNSTYIDPSNIPDSIFTQPYHHDSLYFLLDEFETKFKKGEINNSNIHKYLKVIFWYRDSAIIPIFKLVIEDPEINSYFKALSIYAIGEIGLNSTFDYLVSVFKKENVLIREYIASALGKTGRYHNLERIKELILNEKDFYVRKSIKAAISRVEEGYHNYFSYLPKYDEIGFKKIDFYLNVSKCDTGDHTTFMKTSNLPDHTVNSFKPIAPHLQFKSNNEFYTKIEYPFKNFGIKAGEDIFHTGEDCGCLFTGMAIHSILEGVVVSIQHEGSWGVLVSIQTTIANGEVVTVHYGHMAHDLNVKLDQVVKQGDKIGEIGPSLTFQNGGYLSHLHIGIEKLPYDQATYSGYSQWIESFYDPMELICKEK